jgi:hypothetical protein
MDNFIIEEVLHYKVSLYSRNAGGERTDYGIQFRVPSGIAILRFTRDYEIQNSVEKKGKSNIYHVYIRAEKYPAYIDILRYEKPIFFYYDLANNLSYITTSDEPVGEGEDEID